MTSSPSSVTHGRRRYVTLAEAADYLSVTDRTIRQMIADGRGWVEIIEGPAEPPPDLGALAHAVADLEAAEQQLEQTAGPAAQPRGGRSGSAAEAT